MIVTKTDAGVAIETNTYGTSRERLKKETGTGAGAKRTYYAWGGTSVICEYTETGSQATMGWSKAYVYAGSRLLSTSTKNHVIPEVPNRDIDLDLTPSCENGTITTQEIEVVITQEYKALTIQETKLSQPMKRNCHNRRNGTITTQENKTVTTVEISHPKSISI